jgi:hypothetical protein
VLFDERGGGLAESVEGVTGELAEVVGGFRSHPGLLGKAQIAMVTDILGPTDWDRGPGDDAAVLPQRDGQTLVAGEAMWPPFVERDPYGAGIAAVLANVNDVAAMGGRPEAVVDTIVADASRPVWLWRDYGSAPSSTACPWSEVISRSAPVRPRCRRSSSGRRCGRSAR